MIPYNPYLFTVFTAFLLVAPIILSPTPGVTIPPFVFYLVGIVSAFLGVLLKMMQPAPDPKSKKGS